MKWPCHISAFPAGRKPLRVVASSGPSQSWTANESFFLTCFGLLVMFAMLSGCAGREGPTETGTVIVFQHGKIAGDPEPLNRLIERFESQNPDIRVKDVTLPASTDEQHQFYVINLEAGSTDFDVLSMDVIWVPEFARAGWLKGLSDRISDQDRKDFFPGPMEAVTFGGEVYAIPWYVDAGLLYYRKDLLGKYGISPPRTWHELVESAQLVMSREPGLYGFIWQGKQYEGLVCNVLEYMWAKGGEVLSNGRVVIDSPENRDALRFMRDLIERYKITPALVTTSIEEPTRHIFGNGKSLFMRNWPYAWNIFESGDSPVRGKVGVTRLPTFGQGVHASVLGGWQLGINRNTRHPEAAARFILFLTSAEAQKRLALTIGYKPSRKSLYRDADLVKAQPFMAGLYDIFMEARPRPVTPFYMMMSQVMQPEFSAAISGIRSPGEALLSAKVQIEHILGVER